MKYISLTIIFFLLGALEPIKSDSLDNHFEKIAWLNPVPDDHWDYTSSVCIIRDAFDQRMYALTLKGLETAMTDLSK